MKSVLVIGMGRFGTHLAQKMIDLGNEVMIVDNDADLINELASRFSDSMIGDCTDEAVLKEIGVDDFDICFVTIGSNYAATVEITSLLKDLGAKKIVVKAGRDRHMKILKKLGADEIVYPEREMAEHLAVKFSSNSIFDFIKLDDDFAVYEINVPKNWIGKSISGLDVRKKYNMNIIAVKSFGEINSSVLPSYVFRESDNIIIVGKEDELKKYLK